MLTVLKFLPGFLWALPVSLLTWIFFCIPYYLKGAFEKVTMRKDLSIIWDVANDSKFYKKSMTGWYGFVLGCNIVVVDVPSKDDDWWADHLDHETTHVYQNYIFGILFYVVYLIHMAYLLAFCKDKHSYHDNFLERWARKSAGQLVDIPREDWMDGPNDRFPWN